MHNLFRNLFHIPGVLLIVLSIQLNAQIQGVVVDWKKRPVSGCQIGFTIASGNAQTQNGNFSIVASGNLAAKNRSVLNHQAFLSNGFLFFSGSPNTQIEIFGASGKVHNKKNLRILDKRYYKLALSTLLPKDLPGHLLFLRIKTEKYTTSFKVSSQILPNTSHPLIPISTEEFSLKKAKVAVDSLVIDCPGPHDKKIPLSGYTNNFGNIELDKPPHIVLVLTDDQGYGEIGAHGNEIIQTPNLDNFHGISTRFTNYHVAPTCSPTRTQLLSGRHEFRYGVTHTIYGRERMALSAYTIADLLGDAGYKTGVFGKWHVGDDGEYVPNKRGFQEALVHRSGAIWAGYFDPPLYHNGDKKVYEGYSADIFFDEAIKWMSENKDTPTFTYIASNTPHSPCIVEDKYSSLYSNLFGRAPPLDGESYYGMITNIDDNFGKLRDSIRAFGIEENTVVIFMTDNGHSIQGFQGVGHRGDGTLQPGGLYNAGMRGGKHQPWDGGHRVPNFWYWPGKIKGGVDINAITAGFDTYPTLAEIAGASIPNDVVLDGRSYYPLMENPNMEWPERFLVVHEGRWEQGEAVNSKYRYMGIRSQNFNFVMNNSLYDMVNDPGETKNVIDQHPEIVAEMRAFYDQWWEETLPLMVNEQ